jgi:glycerophosphoryl diester phosphodiesterase
VRNFELQGHRGARGMRPENTLPSFEFALDAAVTSIETDVHLSADDVPVLFHDPVIDAKLCRLPATLGPRRLVRDLTCAELRSFPADRNPDSTRFPEQQAVVGPLSAMLAKETGVDPFAIPTVAELLAFVRAYAGEAGERAGKSPSRRENAARVVIDLELKRVPFCPQTIGDDFRGSEPGLLERRVVAEIRQADMLPRARVRSFDHRVLAAVKKLEPDLTTALLMAETAPLFPGRLAREAGADLYCPDYRFVDEELVRRAHADGVRVLPWTVNDPGDAEKLLSWGVDGITTDFPERFAAVS